MATTLALILAVLPLAGAALERENSQIWPQWLRLSTLALIVAAAALALLLIIISVQEYMRYGLTPYRLFAFGVRGCTLIAAGALLTTFWHGQRGVQRGLWALASSLIIWCLIYASPLFNAEAISANNLVERLRTDQPTELRIRQIERLERAWGKPGAAALAIIEAEGLMPEPSSDTSNLIDINPYLEGISANIKLYPADQDLSDWFAPGEEPILVRSYEAQELKYLHDFCPSDCYGFLSDWLPSNPEENASSDAPTHKQSLELLTIVILDDGTIRMRIWEQEDGRGRAYYRNRNTVRVINGDEAAIRSLINALKDGTAIYVTDETPLIKTPGGIMGLP